MCQLWTAPVQHWFSLVTGIFLDLSDWSPVMAGNCQAVVTATFDQTTHWEGETADRLEEVGARVCMWCGVHGQ